MAQTTVSAPRSPARPGPAAAVPRGGPGAPCTGCPPPSPRRRPESPRPARTGLRGAQPPRPGSQLETVLPEEGLEQEILGVHGREIRAPLPHAPTRQQHLWLRLAAPAVPRHFLGPLNSIDSSVFPSSLDSNGRRSPRTGLYRRHTWVLPGQQTQEKKMRLCGLWDLPGRGDPGHSRTGPGLSRDSALHPGPGHEGAIPTCWDVLASSHVPNPSHKPASGSAPFPLLRFSKPSTKIANTIWRSLLVLRAFHARILVLLNSFYEIDAVVTPQYK